MLKHTNRSQPPPNPPKLHLLPILHTLSLGDDIAAIPCNISKRFRTGHSSIKEPKTKAMHQMSRIEPEQHKGTRTGVFRFDRCEDAVDVGSGNYVFWVDILL